MRIHHFSMEVNNLEESIDFYNKYLGFQTESRMFCFGEEIVFMSSEEVRLEFIYNQQGKRNDQTTHLCFEVTNLGEMINKLDINRKIEGPYTLQNGWKTVFFEGPNQEVIEFLQI